MSRELAIVHGKDGIRINSLCPGPLNTPLLQNFLDTPEKKLRRTIHLPTGRFGEAIEQAYAAVFLASDESSYITATVANLSVSELTLGFHGRRRTFSGVCHGVRRAF